MNYLFQFNQLSLSARSIPGHEWNILFDKEIAFLEWEPPVVARWLLLSPIETTSDKQHYYYDSDNIKNVIHGSPSLGISKGQCGESNVRFMGTYLFSYCCDAVGMRERYDFSLVGHAKLC